MSTHASQHHSTRTSDLLYPPSHKSTVKYASTKPSTHVSKNSTPKLSTQTSHIGSRLRSLDLNKSVDQSAYSFQDEGIYESTPVDDQEILADACYDNYQLMISVFMKLSKDFERISDEVDECIRMANKAFDMVDFTQFDMDQFQDVEDEIVGESVSEEPRKASVRFSYKNIIHDDPNIAPSCVPLSSNPTLSNYRSSPSSINTKSFTASELTRNPSIVKSIMTAKSFGGEKSVASLKKSIAASIISGKSLSETNRTISRKVLEDNQSVLSAKSDPRSHVSHATLANLSGSRAGTISGATLKTKSSLNNSMSKSYLVDEPMSVYENPNENSLGKSMMSGVKSLVSRGKSLVSGRSESFGSHTRGSASLRESKLTMRSHDSGKSFTSASQSRNTEKPSMMSRIKSFFTGASTANDEPIEDVYVDEISIQRRFIELWERIIGKLTVTSNQFKTLSELAKSPAMLPNDAFQIPIMELPTHADGQPLSADELIHALHNTIIPQKANRSKVHSLIINVIVAHCEIRNAEVFLKQLNEKMEVVPKRLKTLSARRIERSKMIVKQCGDELISTDSHYENYMNAYYDALDKNYPPALGTLEDPPLKHSPTCLYQLDAQKAAIYEIRDQYIKQKITNFDDLVSAWLLDYTSICREAGDELAIQDENFKA